MRTLITAVLIACTSTALLAEERTVAKDNTFGCIDYEYYSHLLKLAVAKDKQGFSKGLMSGMYAEQCALFHAGEKVNRVDNKITGQAQVRRGQDGKLYWIASDVLR